MTGRSVHGACGGPNGDHVVHVCRVDEATTPLVRRAIGRARAGDREALRLLYARYADDIYGYARTIVSDHDEARDLTRLVFARLEPPHRSLRGTRRPAPGLDLARRS